MGMDSGGGNGIQEIRDQPQDWARARTAESYVYTASVVRSKAISQVPLRIWRLDAEGNRVEAVEHDALGVLQQTNPYNYVAGVPRLSRYTLESLDFHGHCAWKLAFGRGGKPTEVYWQIPTSYQPLPDEQEFFGGIRLNARPDRPVPPDQLCYFTTDNPQDPLKGTSKIDVLKDAINLRMYSANTNKAFFRNSMRPDWILSGAFANTEENTQRLRRSIRRWLSGADNRAPLVLGEGMKAQLLTMSHQDAEWLQQQRLSQEDIAAAFGVPVVYLNNLERATYSNIDAAKLMLWHDGMIPDCDDLSADLTRVFLWRFWPDTQGRRFAFGFDYDRIEGLGEDLNRKFERITALMQAIDRQVQNRELTPDQARAVYVQLVGEIGLDAAPWQGDVPGGTTFFQPFQDLPVDQLSVQTIMNIWAMRGQNPEFVEDVPGAEGAAQNADAVVGRMEKPPSAPPAPATPPAPASGGPKPPGPKPPPAQPAKALDVEEVIRRTVEATLAARQAPAVRKGPHPIPVREARLAPVQTRLTKRLKRFFQDLQTETLKTVRGKSLKAQGDGQEADDTALAAALAGGPLYDAQQAEEALVQLITAGVSEAAQAAYGAAREDYELSVNWNEGNPWLQHYMGMRLALVRGIDETTREAIRGALQAGADEGESMSDIGRRVQEVFRQAIDYRAELIARTETIQAYGHASLAAYREAGVAQAKMYDGHYDPECADVDGQVVSLEEAAALMVAEHPNGTRGVAPVVPDLQAMPVAAGFPAPAASQELS